MPRAARIGRWSAVAAAAAAVVLAGCEAAGWPFLRAALTSRMSQSLQAEVRIEGDFRARLLWRPGIDAGRLLIGAAQGVPAPHLLRAERVRLGWRWSDVWRWQRGGLLRVRELRAETLDAHLIRAADGRASWQLGRRAPARGAADAVWPRVDTIEVERAQLHVDDRPLQLQMEAVIEGRENTGVLASETSRGVRASARGRWRGAALALEAQAARALPLLRAGDASAGDGDDEVPVSLSGSIGSTRGSFVGTAADLLGARRLDGAMLLRGPSLAAVGDAIGLTLPRTPPFEIDGRLSHGGDGEWALKAPKVHVGESRLAVDLRLDGRAQPPLLAGTVRGAVLRLADLGPSIGAGAQADGASANANATARSAGRVLPAREFDLPSLRGMNADVALAIDALEWGTPSLAAWRALKTRLRLAGGVLTLDGLQAQAGGGRISGRSTLDGRGDSALWSVDLAAQGMRLESAVPALRRQGQAPYASGELRTSVQASGRGRSTAAILASLDGRAQAQLRAGTLSHLAVEAAGLDVAQALGVAMRGDKPLVVRCALIDARIERGVMTARRALVDTADSTLRVSGAVDLRNEQLGLRLQVKPKDTSPLSLRAPVLIGGTLSDPTVGIEGRRLAPRLAAALALAGIAGPAALLPFIELGDATGADPCAPPGPKR